MFLAAHYGTVEDIEVIWTLFALLGLVFSIFNLMEARKDSQALKALNITNGKSKIAKTAILSEITRVIKQLIFLAIGILALCLPGASFEHMSLTSILINIVIRWGLITASALTTYQAYLAYSLRRSFLDN